MIDVRFDIAHKLIEMDKPIERQASKLLGHNKPFGSRWHLTAGSVDFIPTTKIRRTVDLIPKLNNSYPKNVFERLYLPSNKLEEINPAVLAIWGGAQNVSFYTGFDPQQHGIIEITRTPEQDEPTITTTADLGHMMLLDELIYEQRIIGSSRQIMDGSEANFVFNTFVTNT